MALAREQSPLVIEPRRSRRLAAFVVLSHLLTAAAVLALPAPWVLLLPAVALSLTYQIAVTVLGLAPWSIRAAVWYPDGSWTLTFRSGSETQARLAPSTFVSVSLVVLNLLPGPRRQWRHWRHWRGWSVPLFADALDPEQLRRLRQQLRLHGLAPEPDPAPP